jgi:hypothetical protein
MVRQFPALYCADYLHSLGSKAAPIAVYLSSYNPNITSIIRLSKSHATSIGYNQDSLWLNSVYYLFSAMRFQSPFDVPIMI